MRLTTGLHFLQLNKFHSCWEAYQKKICFFQGQRTSLNGGQQSGSNGSNDRVEQWVNGHQGNSVQIEKQEDGLVLANGDVGVKICKYRKLSTRMLR